MMMLGLRTGSPVQLRLHRTHPGNICLQSTAKNGFPFFRRFVRVRSFVRVRPIAIGLSFGRFYLYHVSWAMYLLTYLLCNYLLGDERSVKPTGKTKDGQSSSRSMVVTTNRELNGVGQGQWYH